MRAARLLIILLPILFTAQACNFFSLGSGDNGSGPRGVFVSVDSGESWQETNRLGEDKKLDGAEVFRLVLEPGNHQNLLLVTHNAGLYASDNKADQWITLLPDFSAYDSFFNPSNKQEIFVAGHRGKIATILKSPDRGATWLPVYNEPTGPAAVSSLIFDPRNPAIFYAGLTTGTVLRSVDSGQNWNVLTDFKDWIVKLVPSPDGRTLYLLGQTGGVRRSADGGRNWVELAKPEPAPGRYNHLYMDPASGGALYLATDRGLFRSQDQGSSWTKLTLPATPETNDVSTVTVNPKKSVQIFAAIRSTVYRSEDRGLTWKTVALPTHRVIWEIVIDPDEPNRIYVGLK